MMIIPRFLIGLIFGLGLILAGMTNPAKILNFLDLTLIAKGQWDPSLILVMAGAMSVTFIGYRLMFTRKKPLFADAFYLPTHKQIDTRLITGAAVFGIGWGMIGLCPGPGLSALGVGTWQAYIFGVPMFIGVFGARYLSQRADEND